MFARSVFLPAIQNTTVATALESASQKVRFCCNVGFNRRFHSSFSRQINNRRPLIGLGSVALFTGGVWLVSKSKTFACIYADAKSGLSEDPSSSLPTFTMEEVSKHNSKQSRIWVTYGSGVYDITDFVPQHPGGSEKIMMAAGGSVDPFWMLYGVHKNPNVLAILEKFRIGNLEESDAKDVAANINDPYGNEPRRHSALRPSSLKPFNAEPPSSLLAESFYTPVDLFYVRNHLPVPEISEKDYELSISYRDKVFVLTLDEIKQKFPKTTVTAAIMCAGNRRSEMSKINANETSTDNGCSLYVALYNTAVLIRANGGDLFLPSVKRLSTLMEKEGNGPLICVKQVKGLSWGHAAVGNATWSGARLIDVLKYLGYSLQEKDAHVKFEGLDTDVSNVPYGASIPLEKALSPEGEVILAYEMNGQPLTRDHGYPVRAIVPGVVGARNVKWLGSITVSEEESDSHWQQNDYKGFSPSVDWDTVDFSKSPAIQELPVISAICFPEDNGTVSRTKDNTVPLKGYAFSGGGRRIVRVDLTADGGKTWHVADIEQEKFREPRHYGWSLWSANIPVDPNSKHVEIWAKAVDSSYNTQPESFANIWNLRGVLSNAYHRVKVTISARDKL